MILDTNALSALADEDPALLALLDAEVFHHLPVVVLGEYRAGLMRSRLRKAVEPWLEKLEYESVVLNATATTARLYAEIFNELRTAGRPIPTHDIWIAALAREHALPVVTRDAHLGFVKGVKVKGW